MKTLVFKLLITVVCLATLILALGLVFIPVAFSQHYFGQILTFIEAHKLHISFAGFLLFWINFSIIMWVLPIFKHSQFETISGKAKVWIENGVIDKNISTYWKEKLPMCDISSHVVFKNNKIHIAVSLPKDLLERESLFHECKTELPSHLHNTLGYIGDCTMSLTSKN